MEELMRFLAMIMCLVLVIAVIVIGGIYVLYAVCDCIKWLWEKIGEF